MHTWILFCGGTGMHCFVDALLEKYDTLHPHDAPDRPLLPSQLILVLPISDDGGSSKGIMDLIGGPPVGDARNMEVSVATAMWKYLAKRRDSPKTHPEDEVVGWEEDCMSFVTFLQEVLRHRLPCGDGTDSEAARKHVVELVSSLSSEKVLPSSTFLSRRLRECKRRAAKLLCDFMSLVDDIEAGRRRELGADNASFDWRGASVGNLILAALVVEHLTMAASVSSSGDDCAASHDRVMTRACAAFWCDVCGMTSNRHEDDGGAPCADEPRLPISIHFVPCMDLVEVGGEGRRRRSDVEGILCKSPMPRVVLNVALADGTAFVGQTSFSYGSRPAAFAEDGRLKHTRAVHVVEKDAAWTPLSSAPVKMEMTTAFHHSRGDCGIDDESPWSYAVNDMALEGLLAPQGELVFLFCRGSFVTSMLASCYPLREWIRRRINESVRTSGGEEHVTFVRSVLMLNGCVDRETSPFVPQDGVRLVGAGGEVYVNTFMSLIHSNDGLEVGDSSGVARWLDGITVLEGSDFDCSHETKTLLLDAAGSVSSRPWILRVPGRDECGSRRYDDRALIDMLLQKLS